MYEFVVSSYSMSVIFFYTKVILVLSFSSQASLFILTFKPVSPLLKMRF